MGSAGRVVRIEDELFYHGGAPGFRAGQTITPHPTHHVDGCEWCASGADDNHQPDRVFATRHRLYAKHYASKYVKGSLYLVKLLGECERSEVDPFEIYSAPALLVVRVSERRVALNPSERRHLWREWRDDDRRRGREVAVHQDLVVRRLLGIPARWPS